MKSFIATTFAITATMAVKLEYAGNIGDNTCGPDGNSACPRTMPYGPMN
jgi:hypothetical protein